MVEQGFPIDDNDQRTDSESQDSVRNSTPIYFPGKELYQNENLLIYPGNLLPHWELNDIAYHISFRLADAIPVTIRQQLQEERKQIFGNCPEEEQMPTKEEIRRFQYLYSEKIEKYLDSGYGSCVLREESVAKIVCKSLEFYEGQKYLLHAWCIMPNHVHVVFQALRAHTLAEILHGWKSFTSHAINKLLNRKGQLWQDDSYNHIIRTSKEYYFQVRYVWNNPENAGFHEWKWRWKRL
ncbi:MAG: transposase [Victivallales bacterium]|nr:transposase [Victivallales bacterium]